MCDSIPVEVADPLKGCKSHTLIVSPCNGVVWLMKRRVMLDNDIYLWNLATRKGRLLPKPPCHLPSHSLPSEIETRALLGLGYDHLNDDYKVLTTVDSQIRRITLSVYSLKTNSWTQHETIFNEFLPHSEFDIWLMNDDQVEISWSRLISVEPGIFGSFETVRPVAFLKVQNDVLFMLDEERLVWYDRVQNEVKNVTVYGLQLCFDFLAYTENLVQRTCDFKLEGKQQNL
ncbi:hypothetical protein POM88_041422 [Heracleum sosnowskyi]|uniref:F-box associated beta-propeller type 1 domain-containing protein n=1 Tax=Heracleum sosnowskyi TaxID=360622 RepID=A0AAD8HG55_9APIA|nr:hypothetical protein POM88_041422 [Heracleum sosnowskyi]